MKINYARIYPLSIPLVEPIKMSGETITFANTIVLELRDSAGNTGWGEASVAPLMTGETLDSLLASIKYLVSKCKEFDWDKPDVYINCLDKVLYGNSSAKSCLEMALMDLHTQEARIPLWKFLRNRLAVNAGEKPQPLSLLRMLGGTLDKEIADAKKFHDAGYRHWKIKVGLLPLSADLDRVQFLCKLLDTDTVSVDANGAFSLEDAIRFCTSEKTKGLAFAEQLISPDLPITDFIKLRSKSNLPIGLDESIHGKNELERFIAAGATDGASLKLIKTGGLLGALTCASLLESNGLKINLACKVAETSIGAAAAAAVGFALDKLDWGFSMSNQYLQFDVCESPLLGEHGCLHHHQFEKYGIGVSPDPYRLQKLLAKSYSPIAC
jgi:L-alanine-DL-glutamate epimerase-like enolase superfamily enzyme